jgi:hypothetical protein
MSQQCGSQNREPLVDLQTSETFLGFQHGWLSLSQRYSFIAPAFDVATDLPQHGHQALDRIGAAERAPQFVGQAEPDHGTHRSLNKDPPISRAADVAGRIFVRPILSGLHH